MPLEFHESANPPQALLGEITEFLDTQETSHIFQFPQWNGSGAKFVLLRDHGQIRWLCTFGTHSPLGSAFPWMRALVANRGPVCDDFARWQSSATELIERLRNDGVTYFDAVPDWLQTSESFRQDALRNGGWQEYGSERVSLRLDLTRSEEEIFNNFRKNTRYEIRRTERVGVSIKLASTAADIEEFLVLHAGLSARKGFEAESREEMGAAISWLTKAESRGGLLLARAENRVLGGTVIGRTGKRCWYIWGAAEKHEQFNVGHILQWRALLWAKSHGCQEYDFGGYTPGAISGPAWFKAGFGGRVVRFVRPLRRVIRPIYYRAFDLACRVRGIGKVASKAQTTEKIVSPMITP